MAPSNDSNQSVPLDSRAATGPPHPKRKDIPRIRSAPTLEAQPRFILNSEQEQAFRKIDHRLKEGGFETFLLHGVTGSGKTEVYLRAMEQAGEPGVAVLY